MVRIRISIYIVSFIKVFLLFFLLTFTQNEKANAKNLDIIGANDPKLYDALDQWLSGRDDVAYLALSNLAKNGNSAAQIFLGVLSGSAYHTGRYYLDTLPYKKRRTLTKDMSETKFGRSWLRTAAKSSPLAELLLQDSKKETALYKVRELLKLNEHYTINGRLNVIYNQRWGSISHLVAEGLLDERYQSIIEFAYLADYIDQNGLNEKTNTLLKARGNYPFSDRNLTFMLWGRSSKTFPEDDTYPDNITSNPALLNQLKDFTDTDIRMEPVRFLCSRICPETSITCGVALRAHFRSYSSFWPITNSPLETLVSTEAYRNSKRFPDDMHSMLNFSKADPEKVRQIDACFADYIITPIQ